MLIVEVIHGYKYYTEEPWRARCKPGGMSKPWWRWSGVHRRGLDIRSEYMGADPLRLSLCVAKPISTAREGGNVSYAEVRSEPSERSGPGNEKLGLGAAV